MQYNESKIKKIGDIKKEALFHLKGRWGISILSCLLYFILLTFLAFLVLGYEIFNTITTPAIINETVYQSSTSNLLFSINQLLNLLIVGPLTIGLSMFFLNLVRGTDIKLKDLFFGFKKFLKSFLLSLVIGIYKFLWALAIILPFIIFSFIIFLVMAFNENPYTTSANEISFRFFFGVVLFVILYIVVILCYYMLTSRYRLSYYIYIDNNDKDVLACIKESKEMMKGFKKKLLLMYISFIGWYLLSCLTIGIGFLWLIPYIQTSTAVFYDNLKIAYSEEEEKISLTLSEA